MANDLIDRRTLVGKNGLFAQRRCPGNCQHCNLWSENGCLVILEAPSVDAVEIVHAEWLDGCGVDRNGNITYESMDCSACGEYIKTDDREYWKKRYEFCPFCGAKMDMP